jgi:hypothetical protein
MLARKAKEDVYTNKALVITILRRLGRLRLVGLTDGEANFAVFRAGGYCFQPFAARTVAEKSFPFSGNVEAKPKASKDMRLRDAWATVRGFLCRNPPTSDDGRVAQAATLPPRDRGRYRPWDDEDDDCHGFDESYYDDF